MDLSFIHKRVYGRSLYYPACNESRMICDLMQRKCLGQVEIDIIKAYKVELIIKNPSEEGNGLLPVSLQKVF